MGVVTPSEKKQKTPAPKGRGRRSAVSTSESAN